MARFQGFGIVERDCSFCAFLKDPFYESGVVNQGRAKILLSYSTLGILSESYPKVMQVLNSSCNKKRRELNMKAFHLIRNFSVTGVSGPIHLIFTPQP